MNTNKTSASAGRFGWQMLCAAVGLGLAATAFAGAHKGAVRTAYDPTAVPQLKAGPGSVQFGTQFVRLATSREFTVTNKGEKDSLLAGTVSFAGDKAFRLGGGDSFRLKKGESK